MSEDCALEAVGKCRSCSAMAAAWCAVEDAGVDAKLGAADMSAHNTCFKGSVDPVTLRLACENYSLDVFHCLCAHATLHEGTEWLRC